MPPYQDGVIIDQSGMRIQLVLIGNQKGYNFMRTKANIMQTKVRLAIKDDLCRIAEMTRALTIHLGAYEWTVENHLKYVKRRFSRSKYIHMVAVVDNKVVGFTGAELKSKRTAYMMKGYVEPGYRRKGIMRLMESELVETLKKQGVKKIDLKVDSNNPEGKKTWVSLGYKTIRETMRKQI